jgi:hypothetical protein
VRIHPLVGLASLSIGCGGSIAIVPDVGGDPEQSEAAGDESDGGFPADSFDGSASDADASDASDAIVYSYSPLTWSQVSANISAGDVVSIWGTGPADVYVGTDMQSVYHIQNGHSKWTGVPGGVVGAGWGSDPQNVYASGASAWFPQTGAGGGLFQLSGNYWNQVALGTLYAVWGSSAGDVYAVGVPGILHSINGGPFAAEGPTGMSMLSVWGSGPNDVYVASSGATSGLWHSTGDGTWSPITTVTGGSPWAIWGSGAGDVYVVVSSLSPGAAAAVLARGGADGGWASQSVSSAAATIVSIWGSSAHDIYVAGWHHDSRTGRAGDLYHSLGDGSWAPVNLPGNLYEVTCVWGSGATDVYVGAFSIDDGPIVLHGQP